MLRKFRAGGTSGGGFNLTCSSYEHSELKLLKSESTRSIVFILKMNIKVLNVIKLVLDF